MKRWLEHAWDDFNESPLAEIIVAIVWVAAVVLGALTWIPGWWR
jgi:hypothetical protein